MVGHHLEEVVRLLRHLLRDAHFDGVQLVAQALLDEAARALNLLGEVFGAAVGAARGRRQLEDGLERLRLGEVERGIEEDARHARCRRRTEKHTI